MRRLHWQEMRFAHRHCHHRGIRCDARVSKTKDLRVQACAAFASSLQRFVRVFPETNTYVWAALSGHVQDARCQCPNRLHDPSASPCPC